MDRKRYSVEQINRHLRQAEVFFSSLEKIYEFTT